MCHTFVDSKTYFSLHVVYADEVVGLHWCKHTFF